MRIIVMILIGSLLLSCQFKKKHIEQEEIKQEVNYLLESKEDIDQRMQWWRNAKFGMFIHWGVYAIPAGIHEGKKTDFIAEWIMNTEQIPIDRYEEYARQFNPEKYDADSWMKLASEAGVKYIVITSKHHDGFALWDSKVSDYDIVDFSPYKKDILKALSEACKKYNIKFGLYYSIMDWHHPKAQSINEPHYWESDGPNKSNPQFAQYLEEYMKPQLKELIDEYDPAILWFDGEWVDDYTHEQGQALYQYIRELKPNILINNRVDKGRQGMQGMNAEGDFAGDFGTPEQEILEEASDLDWESCMTMNDTWGYDQTDENWKSTAQLIHNLIDVAAKGGNYLLNVGPTGEGLIPMPSIERLHQIRKWMKVNGESIYDTRKLEKNFSQPDSLRYTHKKNTGTYYAIKMESLPKSLILHHIKPSEETVINLLGYGDVPLDWNYDEPNGGIIINIPEGTSLRTRDNSKAWVFKIDKAKEQK